MLHEILCDVAPAAGWYIKVPLNMDSNQCARPTAYSSGQPSSALRAGGDYYFTAHILTIINSIILDHPNFTISYSNISLSEFNTRSAFSSSAPIKFFITISPSGYLASRTPTASSRWSSLLGIFFWPNQWQILFDAESFCETPSLCEIWGVSKEWWAHFKRFVIDFSNKRCISYK